MYRGEGFIINQNQQNGEFLIFKETYLQKFTLYSGGNQAQTYL